MVNYYTKFEAFVEQEKLRGKTMPLHVFEKKMMVLLGIGGRSKAVSKWLNNFKTVGFIKIFKDRNKMDNDDNRWMVTILDGEKKDEEKECKV